MKRLKKYFLDMDMKDTNYNAIYIGAYGYTEKGELVYNSPSVPDAIFDPMYWQDEISYTMRCRF